MTEEEEPSSVKQAMQLPEAEEWMKAINKELQALEDNHVMSEVEECDVPQSAKIISSRYVFKIKRDENDVIRRRKARLVIKGNFQREGIDYQETFAPTVPVTTMLTVLAKAATDGWFMAQMDVDTAFLNAKIDNEIFMRGPNNCPSTQGKIFKLNKSLYGLKQAPRLWNQCIDKVFSKDMGMTKATRDSCLYMGKSTGGNHVWTIMYVDDLIIMSDAQEGITWFKESM